MAMKSYLRYEPSRSFGVISSPQCNISHDCSGNLVLSGAGSSILVWNVRKSLLVGRIDVKSENYPYVLPGEVSIISCSPDQHTAAIGYSTGAIRIIDYKKMCVLATFRGHRTRVMSLAYDTCSSGNSSSNSSSSGGMILASGGGDNDIVIWDIVSLTAKFRLRGHKGPVTCLKFVYDASTTNNINSSTSSSGSGSRQSSYLLSGSTDTLLKVWDVNAAYCIQTIVGHRCEIHSMTLITIPVPVTPSPTALPNLNDANINDNNNNKHLDGSGSSSGKKKKEKKRRGFEAEAEGEGEGEGEGGDIRHMQWVVTGSADEYLRAFEIIDPTTNNNSSSSNNSSSINVNMNTLLIPRGGILRVNTSGGRDRCSHLVVSPSNSVVVAQGSGKFADIYRLRSFKDATRRMQRRLRRLRSKENKSALKNKTYINGEGLYNEWLNEDDSSRINSSYGSGGISVGVGSYNEWDHHKSTTDASKTYDNSSNDNNSNNNNNNNNNSSNSSNSRSERIQLSDVLTHLTHIKASTKIRGCSFPTAITTTTTVIGNEEEEEIKGGSSSSSSSSSSRGRYSSSDGKIHDSLVVARIDNSIDLYQLHVPNDTLTNTDKDEVYVQEDLITKTKSLDINGHRGDVRVIAVSPDNTLLLTAGPNKIKFWSVKRTIEHANDNAYNSNYSYSSNIGDIDKQAEYASQYLKDEPIYLRSVDVPMVLSAIFVAGGQFAIVGTQSGELLVIDAVVGEVVFQTPAHQKDIWGLELRPDGSGCMSCSGDGLVKLWEFRLGTDNSHHDDDSHSSNSSDSSDNDGNDNKKKDIIKLDYNKGQERMPIDNDSTNNNNGVDKLTLHEIRLARLESDVLCCCYNKSEDDSKLLLAVGLLDNTIKVYFEDSMKFYLSLYGHALPVLSCDIASDTAILCSGSADKTLKIWGLDFGDCHRSLKGHTEAITKVLFQNKTHYVFSCDKSGCIKYWDVDRFEQILTLPGHVGSCWSLSLTSNSKNIFSCGADRSIKLWSRTDDIVYIEEEKERYLDAQVELSIDKQAGEITAVSNFTSNDDNNHDDNDGNNTSVAPLAATTTTVTSTGDIIAGMSNLESVKGGERIIQALDLIEEEVSLQLDTNYLLYNLTASSDHSNNGSKSNSNSNSSNKNSTDEALLIDKPSNNPIMLRKSPLQYMIHIIRSIPMADINQSLLVLPFHYAARLLKMLILLLNRALEVELVSRLAVMLVHVHYKQLIATRVLIPELLLLQELLKKQLFEYRTMIGTNMAGMQIMDRIVKSSRVSNTRSFNFSSVSVTSDSTHPLTINMASTQAAAKMATVISGDTSGFDIHPRNGGRTKAKSSSSDRIAKRRRGI